MGRHKKTPEEIEADQRKRTVCAGCGYKKLAHAFADAKKHPVCYPCQAIVRQEGIKLTKDFKVLIPCGDPSCSNMRTMSLRTRLQNSYAPEARCVKCAAAASARTRALMMAAKEIPKPGKKSAPKQLRRRGGGCEFRSPVGCRICIHSHLKADTCLEDANWDRGLHAFADMRDGIDEEEPLFANSLPLGGMVWIPW
jgi:hypothetical protein